MARPVQAQHADAERAERLVAAWQMKIDGNTEQQIADHFGVNQSTVSRWLKKAYQQRTQPVADELRAVEIDKLDQAEQAVLTVLRRTHPHVSAGGRLVYDPDTGAPLVDDGPTLAAVDRLVKISTRRAALLGLDAPAKVEANVTTPSIDTAMAERLAAARARVAERKQAIAEEATS